MPDPFSVSIAYGLGTAIGKAILQRWLNDQTAAQQLGSALLDLVSARLHGAQEARRIARQLQTIGDRVAKDLHEVFEREGVTVPENERRAVAHAVARTFDRANTGAGSAIAANLTAHRFARDLLSHAPAEVRDLSESGTALYRRIIERAAEEIVAVASELPGFSEASTAEILRRLERIEKALHNTIPSRAVSERVMQLATVGEFALSSAANAPSLEAELTTPLGPPRDVALLPEPASFIGREAATSWMTTRLRSGQPIVAVTGMSGIGKSSLVGHVLRDVLPDEYPDGVAVVSGRDVFDEQTLLRRSLGRYDPQRSLPNSSNSADLLDLAQRLLAGKRCMVVFDGVEPGCVLDEVIRVLRGVGAAVVITSQHAEPAPSIPRNARLELGPPGTEDGIVLLAVCLGREATGPAFSEAEREAALRIVTAVDAHPLALELIGAYIADRKLDLVEAANDFVEPSRVLSLPRGEVPAPVEAALSRCYAALTAEAARVLDACSEFVAAEFGRGPVQALARCIDANKVDRIVDMLVLRAFLSPQRDNHLPAGPNRDRLRLHPLVRALAAAHANERPVAERCAARLALAHYYADNMVIGDDSHSDLGSDNNAHAIEADWDKFVALLDADGGDMTHALEWLLSPDAQEVPAEERDTLTERLCAALLFRWRVRHLMDDGLRFAPAGIAASERLLAASAMEPEVRHARRLRVGSLQFAHAEALGAAGRFDEAEAELRSCLEIRKAEGDRLGQAAALQQLGELARLRGNIERAAELLHESLTIVKDLGVEQAEAAVHVSLGRLELNRSRRQEANRHLVRADTLATRFGYERTLIDVRLLRGQLALLSGNLKLATQLLEEAYALAGQWPKSEVMCMAAHWLGQLARKRGDVASARDRYTESLRLAEEGAYHRQRAIALNALGNLAFAMGQLAEAQRLIEQSLAGARDIGDVQMEGTQLAILAAISLQSGNLDMAESQALMALPLSAREQHAEDEGNALLTLGQVALQRNQIGEARSYLTKSIACFERAGRGDGLRIARALLLQLKGR